MGGDAIARFFESAWIIFQALFRWFEVNTYLATKVVSPVLQLVFFSLLATFTGGPSRVAYLVVGNSVALAGLGGIWAAWTVGEERAGGTLALLLASPASRLVNFLQRGVVHLADALLTVGVAWAAALLLFHVDLSRADVPLLVTSVVVCAGSSIGIGLMLGAVSLAYADVFFLVNLLYYALLVLAGVNVPVAALPGWLRPVSEVLPFTHGIAAARAAVGGAGVLAASPLLLQELGLGVAYLAAGYLFLARLERIAVRRGSLEKT